MTRYRVVPMMLMVLVAVIEVSQACGTRHPRLGRRVIVLGFVADASLQRSIALRWSESRPSSASFDPDIGVRFPASRRLAATTRHFAPATGGLGGSFGRGPML